MHRSHYLLFFLLFFSLFTPLAVFATWEENDNYYDGGLPRQIDSPGEKVIVVDPRIHAWGAYTSDGRLVRSGVASAGADWCKDIGSSCHTEVGSFRIHSLGGSHCTSPSFPLPNGGAPMPYCMYFTEYQALHGSPDVVRGNISHGCVRLHVNDARWLRYNFVEGPNSSNGYQGTLVIIRPY